MIPIGTDVPQRRIPWMNILLIFANVIVYFISHAAPDSHKVDAGTGLAPEWARLILQPGVNCRLYQFITYQFLHANLMHIAGNMVFLYVFGNNLNEKLGHVGYLAFYLAGGVLAGCGQIMTSPNPTLGASGSISAVTGLFFVLLPRTHIRIFIWYFVYMNVIEIPSMWFIAFCFAKDLAEPFFMGDSSVAHFAHLSGTIAGFLVGLLLLLTHLVQRDHYDLGAMITRWKRRREYLATVSTGYDPFMHGRNPAKGVPPAMISDARQELNSRTEFLRDLIVSLCRQHDLRGACAKYLELLALDPQQVMSAEIQLDLANQFYADGNFSAAAAGYEAYLSLYGSHDAADQIRLLLGVLYTRSLPNPTRAKELLSGVLPRLRDPAQRELAEADLAYLATPVSNAGNPH